MQNNNNNFSFANQPRGFRGRDLIVVRFTTTCAISVSSNPANGEVYSIQLYVIKVISDLWQVGDLYRVLRLPPPIKLTATIEQK